MGEVSKQLAASAATYGFTPSRMATRVTAVSPLKLRSKIPRKAISPNGMSGVKCCVEAEESQSGRVGDPQFCTRCQEFTRVEGVRPGGQHEHSWDGE